MISILEGKVVNVLPAQKGVSGNGKEWQRLSYIIETTEKDSKYTKQVCISSLRGHVFSVDEKVRLGVEIESHEFNGKWYTEVRVINPVDENGKLITSNPPASKVTSNSEEAAILADAKAKNLNDNTTLPF